MSPKFGQPIQNISGLISNINSKIEKHTDIQLKHDWHEPFGRLSNSFVEFIKKRFYEFSYFSKFM